MVRFAPRLSMMDGNAHFKQKGQIAPLACCVIYPEPAQPESAHAAAHPRPLRPALDTLRRLAAQSVNKVSRAESANWVQIHANLGDNAVQTQCKLLQNCSKTPISLRNDAFLDTLTVLTLFQPR